MTLQIQDMMRMGPVIPVLTIENADDAIPLAQTLVGAGVRVLEITLRTAAGFEAIRRAATVEGAIVGAGTVVAAADVDRVAAAGARFIVSPGLTESVARAVIGAGIPFLPGVATASDIMRGLDLGLTHLKFFPAESSGGVAALKALTGPFPNCRFCPTGGITLQNAPSYLALKNVLCVGGSWLVPMDALGARDWPRIGALARAAAAIGGG